MTSPAYRYGRKLAESPGEAVYPLLVKDPNFQMQARRVGSTIDGLFDGNPPVDPHSASPEPGVIVRAPG